MPVTLGMLPARAYQQVSDMIQHVSHVIYYRRDARADLLRLFKLSDEHLRGAQAMLTLPRARNQCEGATSRQNGMVSPLGLEPRTP